MKKLSLEMSRIQLIATTCAEISTLYAAQALVENAGDAMPPNAGDTSYWLGQLAKSKAELIKDDVAELADFLGQMIDLERGL